MGNPWFETRLAADGDLKISHPAHRAFSCLVNWRTRAGADIDEEFPLPWTKLAKWTGYRKDACYDILWELIRQGYLVKRDLVGCPPTRTYKVMPRKPNVGRASQIEVGRKPGNEVGRKPGPHTSTSFQERMNGEGGMENNSGAGAPKGTNGGNNSGPVGPKGWRRNQQRPVGPTEESIEDAYRRLGVTPAEVEEFERERKRLGGVASRQSAGTKGEKTSGEVQDLAPDGKAGSGEGTGPEAGAHPQNPGRRNPKGTRKSG